MWEGNTQKTAKKRNQKMSKFIFDFSEIIIYHTNVVVNF